MRLKVTWTGTRMGPYIPGRWGIPSTAQCPDNGGLSPGGRACWGMLGLPWWTWHGRCRNDKSPRWAGLRIAGGQRWSKYSSCMLIKNTRIVGVQRWTNILHSTLNKEHLKISKCIRNFKFCPLNNAPGHILLVWRYRTQPRQVIQNWTAGRLGHKGLYWKDSTAHVPRHLTRFSLLVVQNKQTKHTHTHTHIKNKNKKKTG